MSATAPFSAPLWLLYRFDREQVLAKIAVESDPGSAKLHEAHLSRLRSRVLADGNGWRVRDILCNSGPRDRAFEEQHTRPSIAIVVEGTFQYRSHAGSELMTPGSLLLGNAGQYFECGHEHAVGDRCLSFEYEPDYFDSIAAEAGASRKPQFGSLRVPPVRELSPVIARALAMAAGNGRSAGQGRSLQTEATQPISNSRAYWEEVAVELAGRSLASAGSASTRTVSRPAAEARVTRVLRMLERHPDGPQTLASLAVQAGLSRYHFLRIFGQLAGLTPHQYIVRARLRRAAMQLIAHPTQVLDIALDSGFSDVSNFNHAFRAEFGVSPSSYRKLGCAGARDDQAS
jgi:AraC-like DNA-binding protein